MYYPTRCTQCASCLPFLLTYCGLQSDLPVLKSPSAKFKETIQISRKDQKALFPGSIIKVNSNTFHCIKEHTVLRIHWTLRHLLCSAKHLHASTRPLPGERYCTDEENRHYRCPGGRRVKSVQQSQDENAESLPPGPALTPLGHGVSPVAAHLSTTNNFPITFLNKSSASQSQRQASVHFKKKNRHNAASVIQSMERRPAMAESSGVHSFPPFSVMYCLDPWLRFMALLTQLECCPVCPNPDSSGNSILSMEP